MTDDRSRIDTIADAVADGKPVAWDDVLGAAPPVASGPIRALQLIDHIGAAYRSLHIEMDAADDAAVTRTSGPRLAPDGPLPTIWGPLERLELVGEGTFGHVFRAWDPRLERTVALKLLRRKAESNSDLADRVLREGRLLAWVRHPNVAVVYGVEEHDGRVGTWMEFVEGRTLDALVKERGPFGPREAAVVGVELCRALAAVHGSELLHRDVKAQNVMREDGGRIVLMDFGAGLDLGSGRGVEGLSGTPLYMAPELLDGERASVDTDLYALGVLLFFLVTGAYPVEADTLPALKRAHESGNRRRLRDLRPDVPADFASVVQTAIAPRPQDRFRTSGALEEALSETMKERKSLPEPQLETSHLRRGAPMRFGIVRLSLMLAASLVVAGMAFLIARRVGKPDTLPELQSMERHGAEPGASASGGVRTPTVPQSAPTISQRHESGAPGAPQAEAHKMPSSNVTTPAVAVPALNPPDDLQIAAAFYRDRKGLRERLVEGARVSVGDTISLELETSEPVHVYVLHEDDRRQPMVLFPNPGYVPSNPVPAGSHRLPGLLNGKPKDWEVDAAEGHERILVVASRTPLEDLDAALAHSRRPTSGSDLPNPVVSVDATNLARGMGRLVERPDTGETGEDVFELAKKLAANPESAKGIWVRQVELENAKK